MERLITFHTQAGAIRYEKILKSDGYDTCLKPVPRQLSSSCGICVETTHKVQKYDPFEDIDKVYRICASGYELEWENE